jgi:hypothetical protein
MLMKDCITDISHVSMRPFERTGPEEEWVTARQSGFLPASAFELYRLNNFLSFGSAPPFLKDPENFLFSYFGLVLRSVMESFQDAGEQRAAFIESHKQSYDVGKKLKGESWDKTADARARREFRDFLIALQTILDSFADLVAIFWPGAIKNLFVGRAQFSAIAEWLRQPLSSPAGILVSPSDYYLHKMCQALSPIVNADPPETDWLPLMRLLRNKAAHLGQPQFRYMGLHDANLCFYTFIPREWPYIWEKHIKPVGAHVGKTVPQLIEEGFIHQDIISFAEGLSTKITKLVDAGLSVFNEAFEQFKNFPFNHAALSQLEKNSKKYAFEYFA